MRFLQIALGRGIPAVGAILFNLYVAAQIPMSEADVFFVWFAVLYVLSFIGKLGFDIYILRDLGSKDLVSAAGCKRLAFWSSLLLVALGALWVPKEVQWLLFSLPLFCLIGINSSVLRVKGKEVVGGLIEVSLLSFLALVVIFVLELLGQKLSLEVVSYSFFSVTFIVFFVSEVLVGKVQSVVGLSKTDYSRALNGLKFVPSPLMIYLTQWVAILFLGAVGVGSVSLYSVSIRLASGFAFVAITIDAFVAPRFARYLREGDRESIGSLIDLVRKKSLLFLGGGFVVYTLVGRFLVLYFLGDEYIEAFYISIVLALSYCFIAFVGPYQYLLLMGGGEQRVNLCNGVSLLLVFSGCLILWLLSVDAVWAYAAVVSLGRVIGFYLMRYYALQVLLRG